MLYQLSYSRGVFGLAKVSQRRYLTRGNIASGAGVYIASMPSARRPTSRTILTPSSRRLVAGLLIAAGVLFMIGYALQLYVLLYNWRRLGVLGTGPLTKTILGLCVGAVTNYVGWRVGLHRPPTVRP
jgi:hypothetical protein